jgi:hypothetical protein
MTAGLPKVIVPGSQAFGNLPKAFLLLKELEKGKTAERR